MVEEDDSCKQKLLDLAKRLESFSKEDYRTSVWVGLDKVSEEQCCKAINFFKTMKDGNGGWTAIWHERDGRLGAWKNNYRDYIRIEDDFGRYYDSAISINPYYYAVLKRDVPKDATNEEIEKIGREFKEVSDRLFVL
jgi:hypothetical protein